MNRDNLEDLKQLKNWVCWKWEKDKRGNPTKPPYDPKTGQRAASTDPSTWSSYDEVKKAYKTGKYDGIGFVFTNTDYFGIDLDHVVKDGEIHPKASDVLKIVESYTETSPSGDGFHIIGKGSAPEGSKQVNLEVTPEGKKVKFEIYDRKSPRYFTVTENVFRDLPVEERTEEAAEAHRKYWPQKTQKTQKEEAGRDQEPEDNPFEDLEAEQIKERMFNSRVGEKIRRLWEGDLSYHNGDHSAADQSLCNYLAYFTDCDRDMIDRLFRESGLMRWTGAKYWDRPTGKSTYGKRTIEYAINGQNSPEWKEIMSKTTGQSTQKKTDSEADPGRFEPHNVEDYLKTGKYEKDIDYFRRYKDRKTGFRQIDRYLTLYPGLAVFGGATSLGKTSFCVQLADQLIRTGETVLYFAMEQQPIELVTKGLSRTLLEIEPETRLTNIDIKNGATSEKLEEAKRIYAERSKRLEIVNCNFNTRVDQISGYIRRYMEEHKGIIPVIFIDYLQLIAAPEKLIGKSDKEILDYNTKALKMLQQEQELFIVCISNFNRASYLEPVSESSFKESGMIEYCADYLWGLQLSIFADPTAFLKRSQKKGEEGKVLSTQISLAQKLAKLNSEKETCPKEVEFVSLKSRNGKQFYEAFFRYDMEHDLFSEYEQSKYNKKGKKIDFADEDEEEDLEEY